MLDEDKVEEIDGEIVDAIIEDDKEKLISLIHTPGLRPSNSMYNTACHLLDKICSFDAVNCATSLLDGELSPVIRQVDVKKPMMGNGAAFPLHFAANRGASVDTKLRCRLGMQHRSGLLPLEIALDVVSGYLPRDFGATFQLIAPLCHPILKHPLKAIKLLSSYSKNVEKKAYYYAMEGELTEFIVLLAVAHEKVLVPITFSKQDGDCWNGSMTLDQWLAYEFGSLHNEENKVLGSFAKMNVTGIERKERPLESLSQLHYCWKFLGRPEGKERYDKVEKDVTLMLEKAGCRLKDGDFDSNMGNWMNSGDSTRSLPFLHPHLSLQSTCNFPSRVGLLIFTMLST
ncbi:hypothetical protein Vadar_010881 [Vaccinium darrowii]|uniref:Uncharacterized protein n=1 Tax=Vaccinium darrowii TaxID=229202 RepID=A0ACB7XYW4_9ERIC|nr:hypothetical protein Vadar_010881 [Vaccinium darrowii]